MVSSPAYALVQGAKLVVGEAARDEARLHPQQLNNRFWQRLSMNPISHAGDRARHHADLAYAHLLHLHDLAGKPEEVIFAVPGNYSAEQLSVLLGIASHCPFQAVGLVDLAIAAAAGLALANDTVHVELQLHQAVLTKISVGTDVARETVQTREGAGLLALYDRWAHIIADAFIEQCRFDPLHSARTEQHIYDHMPQYLASSDSLVDIEVPQGSGVHRARIERELLLEAGAAVWQPLLQRAKSMCPDNDQCLLGEQWAAVPGIDTLSPQCLLLPANSTALSCLEHIDRIRSRGDGVSFVTRLPKMEGPSPVKTPAGPKVVAETLPPTHVLVDFTAYPLTNTCFLQESGNSVSCHWQQRAESQCALSLQDGQVSIQILGDSPVWLQGRALRRGDSPPALIAGDVLSLSNEGQPVQLIRVAPDART